MPIQTSFPAALLLATALHPVSALAQSGESRPMENQPPQDHHRTTHGSLDGGGEIVVVGHPPVDFGLLTTSASLEGDELVAQSRGQIGEMLSRLPGVSATSFAPGASRPVLRGFDGDRVRVLVDGIGTIDASTVSADHAVVLDPLTVDHIDVVHGPAVLLFGGQAIGGAVNALDKRIPRSVPEQPRGTVIGGYGSAARERFLGGAIDIPLDRRVALHLDANRRKSGDLRVGGHVHSPALRAELLHEAGHLAEDGEADEAAEYRELAGLSDRIPNSGAKTTTIGAGLGFIDNGGNLGLSIQHTDSRYGVPMRPGSSHGHDHAHDDHGHEEAGPVSIDLRQTRIDLRGALEFGGLFDSLQLRGAYGDYRHVELEGAETGTIFDSEGYEVRADLVQSRRGGWRGRSGVQAQWRKLLIDGAEAFTPDYETSRLGLFTLQSLQLGGGFEAEGALRYERARVRAGSIGFARSFDLWSGAVGLSWMPAQGWKTGGNYIRGARSPAPEELLSDGLHVATQSYERGDPAFRTERSDGIEAYIRYEAEGLKLALTGFATDFKGFIAALPTGEDMEGFPVFQYLQHPARFRGFEAEAGADLLRWPGGIFRLEGGADYTRATLKGIGPVPRIPPLRLRGGAKLELGAIHFHGEVEWNKTQRRVAAFENAVGGFTLVNLSAHWHPLGEEGPLTLLLAANNLFDVTGRRAASFTRDFVPIAGRDVRVTAKFSF
ncbi:MAG: TonB-dependent receptor [Novosphingobium sp.]|nr:TonB-dependent receptor [Novosphingobium sp.]